MKPLRRILIVGGGSSGWMSAALLAKVFEGLFEITLVESQDIGTIGVGEATIPPIKKYLNHLQLDEDEFIRLTQASFKLGIQFENWDRIGAKYIHGFGVIGHNLGMLATHQLWLKARQMGLTESFDAFSINTAASLENRFTRSHRDKPNSPLGHIAYAFHLDASLFAKFLSGYAQERGVRRVEGKVVDVKLRGEDGFIESVQLADGQVLEADLFLDCSGFRGLLIEGALKTGFVDWSHWLPCDSALAVPCTRSENFTPYTRSIAHGSGWQWRIPLQHRTGNGHVYAKDFISDDEAASILLGNLDGETMADPLQVRFKAGKRTKLWNKNCVAVGLAGGFLEPLESTSLHLVQSGLIRLIRLFPDLEFDAGNIDEFNRQTDFEYERIRDFIILHYKATERDDTPFWNYCRTMEVPEPLQHKIDLWMANGRVFKENHGLFSHESWIQVFIGQGMIPRGYDPRVDAKSDEAVMKHLNGISGVIRTCVGQMQTHADFVAAHCAAPKMM
ncbi:MAG: tryptophan 7-halogenase [Novosphingobium sp.]|uniref:tryptophan halogenase family protein n=1 Tax=Novosphingobium sp. TaxID=1874826 RepID=UPI0026170A22|nr:tryptophan halogenase family protein [Novosphingobium sp.]MCP5387548.1 tryptophan 7-halogenase [Novosphingobium sp.]